MPEPEHGDGILANLQAGSCAVVVALAGSARRSQRLAELGMTPGVQLDVVRAAPGQPMLLRVRRTLLALDRGSAAEVLVRQVGKRKCHQGWARGFRRQGRRRFAMKRRRREGDS